MNKMHISLTSIALATALAGVVRGVAARDFSTNTSPFESQQDADRHLTAIAAKTGLKPSDVANKRVAKKYTTSHNGVTHVYYVQSLQGIDIANAASNVNVNRSGKAIGKVGSSFVRDVEAKTSGIRQPTNTAVDAIECAILHLGLDQPNTPPAERRLQLFDRLPPKQIANDGGPTQASTFDGAGISKNDITSKLVFYHLEESGVVKLARQLEISTLDQQFWGNIWVNAISSECDILGKSNWISGANYEVFALPLGSPNDGSRTMEIDPADATASPYGWHDTNGAVGAEFTTTRGNNVNAKTDRGACVDSDRSPCRGVRRETQPDGGSGLDFSARLNLATQRPIKYQDAAVINLFYWNNVLHDVLYQYGFDEISGNFQENNYGNGGEGSDSVNAEAQDGSGTNNANFGTPPDGRNPRMQMFEWSYPFRNDVAVNSPSSIAGDYSASGADFGPPLNINGITGDLEIVNDGTDRSSEGCEALSDLNGKIALIDRGTCSFVIKANNAQNAGAIGVIIVNNVDGTPIGLGGTDNSITIPSVMISKADGNTIKAEIAQGVDATLKIASRSNSRSRDSDFDNGVIAHEYCHGLSTRLTGGPQTSDCLSGDQQAGEGWSDLCALFFTVHASDIDVTPRGVGTYVIFEPNDGLGIRPAPYSTDMRVNPYTYGDLTTGALSVPHGVGFVWATAVWEVYWNLVNTYGFDPDLYEGNGGNNIAFQLIVDGLKLQQCNPTFLDARDAILAADEVNNDGANECLIWEGFAKRGMGSSAADGGNSDSLNVVEAFDLPSQCQARRD